MKTPMEKYIEAVNDTTNSTLTYNEQAEGKTWIELRRTEEEKMRILWFKLAISAYGIQKCEEIRTILED